MLLKLFYFGLNKYIYSICLQRRAWERRWLRLAGRCCRSKWNHCLPVRYQHWHMPARTGTAHPKHRNCSNELRESQPSSTDRWLFWLRPRPLNRFNSSYALLHYIVQVVSCPRKDCYAQTTRPGCCIRSIPALAGAVSSDWFWLSSEPELTGGFSITKI